MFDKLAVDGMPDYDVPDGILTSNAISGFIVPFPAYRDVKADLVYNDVSTTYVASTHRALSEDFRKT